MKYVAIGPDVVTAAFTSKAGASNRLLRAVSAGKIVPLLSTSLLLEYESALKQAEARLAHGLSLDDIDAALAALASAAEPVDVTFLWRPQMKDPNDEILLEAAVNGNAEAIVTHDEKTFVLISTIYGVEARNPPNFVKEMAL